MLNIHTDEFDPAGLDPTEFSVLRIKRDILQKSQIGALFTHRSQSVVTEGSNEVFGVDGSFGLSDSLVVGGYYAGSRTEGLEGDDESYRGIFDFNSDLYGARISHTLVGENFNPEIGFLRREDFRESVAKLRLSRRPDSDTIRKVSHEPALEYVTDPRGRLESRQAQMTFRMEIQNGDQWSADYEKNFELLPEPFEAYPDFVLPPGEYDLQNVRLSYQLGPQRKLSGRVTYQFGGFYGNAQRVELSRADRDLSQAVARAERLGESGRALPGSVHRDPPRRPHDVQRVAADVPERPHPAQLVRQRASDERPFPMGVPAGKRLLRGLQRRARHGARGATPPAKPEPRGEAHPARPVLTL